MDNCIHIGPRNHGSRWVPQLLTPYTEPGREKYLKLFCYNRNGYTITPSVGRKLHQRVPSSPSTTPQISPSRNQSHYPPPPPPPVAQQGIERPPLSVSSPLRPSDAQSAPAFINFLPIKPSASVKQGSVRAIRAQGTSY